jgi:RNA polymerase sigma factor (sigma-70 family)
MDRKTPGPDGAPAAPRLTPAQEQRIDRLARLCEGEMAAMAKHLMWQYHIDRLSLAPEGAVSEAVIRFYRAVSSGTIRLPEDRDDLLKAFHALLERFIRDRKKWQDAQKRGGTKASENGRHRAVLRADVDLDQIVSTGSGPDLQVIAEEEAERMLSLLDRLDPSHRAIATLLMRGFTNAEIAIEVGLSLATVERRLAAIRKVWKEFDPNRRDRENPSSES